MLNKNVSNGQRHCTELSLEDPSPRATSALRYWTLMFITRLRKIQFWHLRACTDDILRNAQACHFHCTFYFTARFSGRNIWSVFKHLPLRASGLTWILCELQRLNSTLNSCKIPTGKFCRTSSTPSQQSYRRFGSWALPAPCLPGTGTIGVSYVGRISTTEKGVTSRRPGLQTLCPPPFPAL